MKKLFIVGISLLFISLQIYSQDLIEGSFSSLKNEKELDITVDYSEATILGLKEKDFLALHEGEEKNGEPWADYWEVKVKKQLKLKFISNFNARLIEKKELRGGVFPDASYKLIIHVINITDQGDLDLELELKSSGSVVAKLKITGDGGVFGSFVNLAGDGFEDAGENFGKYILKKAK